VNNTKRILSHDACRNRQQLVIRSWTKMKFINEVSDLLSFALCSISIFLFMKH